MKRFAVFSLGLFLCGIVEQNANANIVGLQNATATFSQNGFNIAAAIDGSTVNGIGWAIDPNEGHAQTAAFETVSNQGFAGGSTLAFTLSQSFGGGHNLGHFALYVTTSDRSTFADGVADPSGTATWTLLTPTVFLSANGATLNVLGDSSILASGTNPDTDVYTLSASTSLTGITGIRLDVLTDPTLPFNGPGRQITNGNFVLTEFGVDITPSDVPEPASFLLIGPALLAIGFRMKRYVKA